MNGLMDKPVLQLEDHRPDAGCASVTIAPSRARPLSGCDVYLTGDGAAPIERLTVPPSRMMC